MKAWLLSDFGLDNLVLGGTATPEPKACELLVKAGAGSLNFHDKAIVDGFYEIPAPMKALHFEPYLLLEPPPPSRPSKTSPSLMECVPRAAWRDRPGRSAAKR